MTDYRKQAHDWAGPGREAAVDIVQAKLHFNESLHMHQDIDKTSCAYCWLRAGKAVMALAEAGLLPVPLAVWSLQDDEYANTFGGQPEVFASERAARAEAVRCYRDANQIGLFEDDPEPDFAWREHHEGGIELYVDAEASGLIVRRLVVKNAAREDAKAGA
jgi:hypothetical protein